MGKRQQMNKNMLGSVGPGGFSGEFLCMRTCFILKYTSTRDCSPGGATFPSLFCVANTT